MPGIRKASGPHKYNKVNQQRKFHLLSLFYQHQIPLKDAAEQVGINFLTAKTIIFFNKKDHKSYQFDLRLSSPLEHKPTRTASYISLRKNQSLTQKNGTCISKVQLFCSTGSIPITSSGSETSDLIESLQKNIEVSVQERGKTAEKWGENMKFSEQNNNSLRWIGERSMRVTPQLTTANWQQERDQAMIAWLKEKTSQLIQRSGQNFPIKAEPEDD